MEFLKNDNKELLSRLEYCTDLPSPPGVALRIIELGRDPGVDMGAVAEAISIDPALVAKILRVANSGLYAKQRKIENLRQALTLLGLNATITIALSFSLVNGLRAKQSGGIDYNHYWARSLTAATCCRTLGDRLKLGRKEDLFLAALLQDIGMLALTKVSPEVYSELGPAQEDHQKVQDIERESLGTDHAAIGAWLLKRWDLPDHLVNAVAGSHDPSIGEPHPELEQFIKCVAISGLIADIWWSGDYRSASQAAANSLEQLLGMPREEFAAVLEPVAQALPDSFEIFEMKLGDAALMQSILEQAKEVLMLRSLQSVQEIAKTQETVESLQSRTEELQEKSERDGLTGIYNRAHLDSVLEEEFALVKAHGWPMSLVFIDLDHFKQVNDVYGHQVGDEVLRKAASLIEQNTRDSDVLARYGGEEFVIVLPGAGADATEVLATRVVNAFRKTAHEIDDEREISVTVSIGCVTHGENKKFDSLKDFVRAADRAVYAAKQAGRDQFIRH